jgi:S1-C subfamily serine protease
MITRNERSARWLVLWLALFPTPGFPDEAATKGQDVFEKNRHAVVTVQITVKASYSKDGQSGPPSEKKYELTGTVVHPSGLTVLARSACEPALFYKQVMPDYSDYKVSSEITDLKMLLDDGTEVPAEIVLRDEDLDLAFARPKAPLAHPMSAVDLSKSASAKVLEQVVALNRLNQVSGRAYAACLERIIAAVSKPRSFYLHDGSYEGTKLGCPVFSLNGDIIGIMVMRVGGAAGDDYRENAASIILPAGEVLKAARQVPPLQKQAGNQAPLDAADKK